MPLPQALRLCPQAVLLPADFPYYEELSRRFHAILADYSPEMEPWGLDEAFLDLTGRLPRGGPLQVAREVRQRVREELSLTCSVGVASSKVMAKVASELSKPDGLLHVPRGREREFLAPLPVGSLPGVGRRTEQALAAMGVRTIGELARLPPELLHARFGVRGHLIWLHARGVDGGPLRLPRPAKSVGRETTFPYDTADRQHLRATLRLQAERIGAELREAGQRARSLVLKLRFDDFATVTHSATLPFPTSADHLLFQTACRLLDRALDESPRPVRLIGLSVGGLLRELQLSLPLDRDSPAAGAERWERLARSLDRVRRRYGPRVLTTAETLLSLTARELHIR